MTPDNPQERLRALDPKSYPLTTDGLERLVADNSEALDDWYEARGIKTVRRQYREERDRLQQELAEARAERDVARELDAWTLRNNHQQVEAIWSLLGREPHREGGESLLGRIRELLDRASSAEALARQQAEEIGKLRKAADNISPYLRWTIGDESPGHHPTMPSAVAAFHCAFDIDTEEKRAARLRAALSKEEQP